MLGSFSYAGLLYWGCKQRCFFFQVSFCSIPGTSYLYREVNRASSSRNKSDYSRRSPQISFPFLESRSCENFELSHFSIVRKLTVYQKGSSVWSTFFSSKKIEIWAVKIGRVSYCPVKRGNRAGSSRNESGYSREAENWSGYLSESSQTHSISSLYWAITNLKAKQGLFVT